MRRKIVAVFSLLATYAIASWFLSMIHIGG